MENPLQIDEQQLHKAESLSRVSLTLVDDLFTSGREVPDEFRKEILLPVKFPSISVIVPLLLEPTSMTEAPIMDSPLDFSTTVPFT